MLQIDRCVCMNCTFEKMKALATANNWCFAQLRAHTGCGMGCGMCVPYVKAMLRTGQTEFHELITPTISAGTGAEHHRHPTRRSHQVG